MRLFLIIILSVLTFGFSNFFQVGHPEPFDNEKLKQAIFLKDNCSEVSIIEWKGYKFKKQDIEIINEVCNKSYNSFYNFISSKNLKFNNKVKPNYKLSLLPWDESFDGKGYRNLNDSKFRFYDRPKICSNSGRECDLNEEPSVFFRGWTDIELKTTFLRNDPLRYDGYVNDKFRAVLAHELFHVMSWESGCFEKHQNIAKEESLAMQFSRYLGYGDL